MTTQRSYQFGGNSNSPFSGLVGIVIGILFFIAMFWFVQIVFRILWFLLPVILIATAIIDYTVITGYLSWIGKLFQRNAIAGIAMTVLTFIGAPVIGLVLLGRALFRKKVKEVQAEAERQRSYESLAAALDRMGDDDGDESSSSGEGLSVDVEKLLADALSSLTADTSTSTSSPSDNAAPTKKQ